jgi:hypothetical protein
MLSSDVKGPPDALETRFGPDCTVGDVCGHSDCSCQAGMSLLAMQTRVKIVRSPVLISLSGLAPLLYQEGIPHVLFRAIRGQFEHRVGQEGARGAEE